MKPLARLLILTCLTIVAATQAATKAEQINEIMRAYGVEETVEETRLQMVKQADNALKGALDQIKTGMPQMSEEGWSKINAAAEKYIKAATGGWNGADVVKEYSRIYEESYSSKELESLAAYLRTPRAQKSIKTEKRAAQVMNSYIMSHMITSMQEALKVFVTELQTIVKEEVTKIRNHSSTSVTEAAPAATGAMSVSLSDARFGISALLPGTADWTAITKVEHSPNTHGWLLRSKDGERALALMATEDELPEKQPTFEGDAKIWEQRTAHLYTTIIRRNITTFKGLPAVEIVATTVDGEKTAYSSNWMIRGKQLHYFVTMTAKDEKTLSDNLARSFLDSIEISK